MKPNQYISTFSTRYASNEMQYIFSDENKFRIWRRLWIALAKAEQAEGLPISDSQIAQLEKYKDDINYDVALEYEKQMRHDVMSHIHAYGEQCPDAKSIIHLGATSCYVGDNADILIMKQALELVQNKLLGVIRLLADFSKRYRDMPTLAYTHLQPAQLTTVGKRATLWISEFLMDYEEIQIRLQNLALLGNKGTTGTQASFIELFYGNDEKVLRLEQYIAKEMGITNVVAVSGQTYSRKVDYMVLSVLAGLGQSASKFANDMRILQSFKEMEEPFAQNQIGSSAMPYKRNPMRSERITALSRFLIIDVLNPAFTSATQWFEHTLDDSANRRISISEAFLAADAILDILLNICDGLVVYPKVIETRINAELPFMAIENILMQAVKKGGDRQKIHERLRKHSLAAAKVIKEDGKPNDLLQRLANDELLGLSFHELKNALNPSSFVGRAPKQVEDFLTEYIYPILEKNKEKIAVAKELNV